MQSDINNTLNPSMWLTVGDGILLHASFPPKEPTLLSVRDRNGLWWNFETSAFAYEEQRKPLQNGELADLIKFFTFYKESSFGK